MQKKNYTLTKIFLLYSIISTPIIYSLIYIKIFADDNIKHTTNENVYERNIYILMKLIRKKWHFHRFRKLYNVERCIVL